MPNSEEFQFPTRGFVFWPVGTGDSTTVCVNEEVVVQLDLNHLQESEEEGDPHTPIVDRLEALVPEVADEPHLAVFGLTHPDQDHCRGFSDLLERIHIGELWFTPRIFSEFTEDLCDDAVSFRDEALRRVEATIAAGGDPGDGDRIRLFGASELLKEADYLGFPAEMLMVPGEAFTTINGEDLDGVFRAFVHAPFKDDIDADRNDASLALQVGLFDGDQAVRALLFGDLSYPVLKKIFDRSEDEDLGWNVMLSPHHCSKSAMYWQGPDDSEEVLKQEILDAMAQAAESPNHIFASSEPVPRSDQKGANPPHAKAKKRYEEVTETFLCTMENPSEEAPEPLVFELGAGGSRYLGTIASAKSATAVAAQARGGDQPPAEPTTYGR